MRYDMIVIGSGPSGRRAAIQAAKLGRSVLVVENRLRVGGVSVHTGIDPARRRCAKTVLNLSGWRERSYYGLAYRVKQGYRWQGPRRAPRQDRLTTRSTCWSTSLRAMVCRPPRGPRAFLDPHRLAVAQPDGEAPELEADRIVVAVGTKPYRPAHIPFDDRSIVDSGLAGGGAARAAQPYRDRRGRDRHRICDDLLGARRAGDDCRAAPQFPRIHRSRDHRRIRPRTAQTRRHLPARLQAGERRARRAGLAGRDPRRPAPHPLRDAALRRGATSAPPPTSSSGNCAGLTVDARGRLAVDASTYQTAVPHIYAVGDVIGFPSLASTSMEQGRIAACHAFGRAADAGPAILPLRHLCGA